MAHTNKITKKGKRELLNEIVRDYAEDRDGEYRKAWNRLYKRFFRVTRINVKVRAKNRNVRALEYAEQNGYLDTLIELSFAEFYGVGVA